MVNKKKTAVEEEALPEELEVWVGVGVMPPDPVKAKADLIRSLFVDVGRTDGILLDPNNPDHLVLLAFYVGSRGLLRR